MDEEEAQRQREEELRQKMLDRQRLEKGLESNRKRTIQIDDEDTYESDFDQDLASGTSAEKRSRRFTLNQSEILSPTKVTIDEDQSQNSIEKSKAYADSLNRKLIKLRTKRMNQKDLKKKRELERQRKQEEEDERKRQEIEMERQEYEKEQEKERNEKLFENLKQFLEDKREEQQKINKEVDQMEQNSDDEFGIYQNFASTQAHHMAKKKVMLKEQRFLKEKNMQQMLITVNSQPLNGKTEKLNVNNNQSNPTNQADEATRPNTISKDQVVMGNTIKQDLEKNEGFQKALKKAQEKQMFAEQIVQVYQKNENIDYDSKIKKIVKKQEIQKRLEEDDGYDYEEEDQQQNYQKDRFEDDESEEENKKYTFEEFDKEEKIEERLLEMKLEKEKKENMARKYLQLCKNEKVLPLPILQKINDGVLTLDDYKLNAGLCHALGSVLEDLGDQIFKIVLRNNGISDHAYSEIIQGAIKNPHIKSLVIRQNEFQFESLEQILKYFDKKKKPILEELVISQCKTKLSVTNELLRVLSDYNNLRVLAICQSKLDKTSVQLLGDIANGNTQLRELDLSWNEVTSLNMWELMQNIEFCRHISYLNLSFNSFAGNKTDETVESLCNFIKRSRSLVHLDISYCGLRKDEVFDVIKACKKSRSLLAVHVSGNLITDETKRKIREYMRPRKRVKDLYDLINAPESDHEENESVKVGNIDIAAAIKQKLAKYAQTDAVNGGGKADSGNGQMKGQPGERLIFSRILGHIEIPRSHKWQESSECWICDHHRYSVLIVSKTIAENFFLKPKNRERDNFIDKLKNARQKQDESLRNNDDDDWGSDNDDIYYDADTEQEKPQAFKNNMIAGQFTKWKCRSMIPLGEFIKRLQKNQQPTTKYIEIEKDKYLEQVKEMKHKQKEKEQKKILQRKQVLRENQIGLEIDKADNQWLDNFTKTDHQYVTPSWLFDLEKLVTDSKHANFIVAMDKLVELNSQKRGLDDIEERFYAFAAYLPPGKHNQKRVKEYRIIRKFEKPKSMFKDWTDDSKQVLKKAFTKDIENSKLSRFIRDTLEFRRVCDVLFEYSSTIKDMFNYCIALSSFPSISWIDFCNLCTEWNIPDNKTCTMQTIDRVFIATNVELVEQEDNPDRDLCRFEFYEIIVRMAGAKYKDSGMASTWDSATKMLLDFNLIPNTGHKMMGGQTFRDQFIWTLPIDDLFRANNDHIQKIYNKYQTAVKRYLDVDDCKQIMAELNLTEFELMQAYSFSKKTIVDEMNQKDKYERMEFAEFLDFICRCAHYKYKEEKHLKFLEKVERVLDILFKQHDCKRQKPDFEIEVSSESDYSSDD